MAAFTGIRRQYNVGRLAWCLKEKTTAFDLFQRSLRNCLHPDRGPTIQAMALLPLSALFRADALGSRDLPELKRQIHGVLHLLNPDYFEPVLAAEDFEDLLSQIHLNPARFFPFNYR